MTALDSTNTQINRGIIQQTRDKFHGYTPILLSLTRLLEVTPKKNGGGGGGGGISHCCNTLAMWFVSISLWPLSRIASMIVFFFSFSGVYMNVD